MGKYSFDRSCYHAHILDYHGRLCYTNSVSQRDGKLLTNRCEHNPRVKIPCCNAESGFCFQSQDTQKGTQSLGNLSRVRIRRVNPKSGDQVSRLCVTSELSQIGTKTPTDLRKICISFQIKLLVVCNTTTIKSLRFLRDSCRPLPRWHLKQTPAPLLHPPSVV
jgi:hypothetical protein